VRLSKLEQKSKECWEFEDQQEEEKKQQRRVGERGGREEYQSMKTLNVVCEGEDSKD